GSLDIYGYDRRNGRRADPGTMVRGRADSRSRDQPWFVETYVSWCAGRRGKEALPGYRSFQYRRCRTGRLSDNEPGYRFVASAAGPQPRKRFAKPESGVLHVRASQTRYLRSASPASARHSGTRPGPGARDEPRVGNPDRIPA